MVEPRSGKEAGVSIRQASKSYGEHKALQDVSLEIAAGEFVSILGPSGSGKTTLLGLLGGFIQPSSGSIWIGGRDITYAPPHKRDIGVVFQNYALFPHMTVAENITFPLRARRLPRASWPAKLDAALDMVALRGLGERRIHELSGGQRQRVALARAMIFEPPLILMDEPLSALDKQLRENMQIELKRLHAKLGATIVYVTHDQREALTMSDRVAVMSAGRLVQVDTPQKVHDRPANAFLAGFIGEATLLPVDRIDDTSVRLGAERLRSAHPVPPGPALFLVIHAEKLVVADPATSDAHNRLTGTVSETIYQGESIKMFVRLTGGGEVGLRIPANHAGRGQIKEKGETVHLALHIDDTVVVPEAA